LNLRGDAVKNASSSQPLSHSTMDEQQSRSSMNVSVVTSRHRLGDLFPVTTFPGVVRVGPDVWSANGGDVVLRRYGGRKTGIERFYSGGPARSEGDMRMPRTDNKNRSRPEFLITTALLEAAMRSICY